jgi:hypothetical protein
VAVVVAVGLEPMVAGLFVVDVGKVAEVKDPPFGEFLWLWLGDEGDSVLKVYCAFFSCYC